MIEHKDKLQLISNISMEIGEGSLVAIHNDIESRWHYYVGTFKPKNEGNHIYLNSIEGKCVDVVIENEFTYFAGDSPNSDLIRTKLQNIPIEKKEFDFRFVWFRH